MTYSTSCDARCLLVPARVIPNFSGGQCHCNLNRGSNCQWRHQQNILCDFPLTAWPWTRLGPSRKLVSHHWQAANRDSDLSATSDLPGESSLFADIMVAVFVGVLFPCTLSQKIITLLGRLPETPVTGPDSGPNRPLGRLAPAQWILGTKFEYKLTV